MAIVGVGIAVSLGLIAVSALLNFRMGYRSADTELDGYIYGAGAGLGDGLKAIAPFMMYWGYRKKDYLAAGAAALLFLIMTGYSFTAALGFAAEHRANKEAANQGHILQSSSSAGELQRLTERLQTLLPQPTPAEVKAELEKLYRQPAFEGGKSVGEVSAQCTLDRKATRQACVQAANIKQRLAKAQEAADLDVRIGALRQNMQQSDDGKIRKNADPQVEAVRRVVQTVDGAITNEDVGFGLSVLLALFVEFGSGMGLYVATTPLRYAKNITPKMGDVTSFAEQRLEPHATDEVTMTVLYAEYKSWCAQQEADAMGRVAFGQMFSAIARDIGLRHLWRDKREVYQNVRLLK